MLKRTNYFPTASVYRVLHNGVIRLHRGVRKLLSHYLRREIIRQTSEFEFKITVARINCVVKKLPDSAVGTKI